jgi:RNA-binding protein NOB1
MSEYRDAESRRRLDEFCSRLLSLRDGAELEVRALSPGALAAVADFVRRTGDYGTLSNVDLQVLRLLYELEREASGSGGGAVGPHVWRVPQGWHGGGNGGGRRADADGSTADGLQGGAAGADRAPSAAAVVGDKDSPSSSRDTRADADGAVDASLVDYDDDDGSDDNKDNDSDDEDDD